MTTFIGINCTGTYTWHVALALIIWGHAALRWADKRGINCHCRDEDGVVGKLWCRASGSYPWNAMGSIWMLRIPLFCQPCCFVSKVAAWSPGKQVWKFRGLFSLCVKCSRIRKHLHVNQLILKLTSTALQVFTYKQHDWCATECSSPSTCGEQGIIQRLCMYACEYN